MTLEGKQIACMLCIAWLVSGILSRSVPLLSAGPGGSGLEGNGSAPMTSGFGNKQEYKELITVQGTGKIFESKEPMEGVQGMGNYKTVARGSDDAVGNGANINYSKTAAETNFIGSEKIVTDGDTGVRGSSKPELHKAGTDLRVSEGIQKTEFEIRGNITSPDKLEPPKVANQPEPPKVANQPEPPKVANQPEPPKVANQPEPPKVANQPEPPNLANQPEPPKVANQPEPPKVANQPEPPKVASQPEPQGIPNQPEPTKVANQPEPPKVANQPEPPKVANQTEPPKVGNQLEPPKVANQPEPPNVANQPEPLKVANQPEPPKVANQPEPPKVANQPEPLKVASQPEPPKVASQPEPQGIPNQPEPTKVANQPEPTKVAKQTDPQGIPNQAEPQGTTNKTGPQRIPNQLGPQGITNKPEPQGITNKPEPQGSAYQPEPQGSAYQPEPQEITNKPEPQGITNKPEPQGITNKLEPQATGGSPRSEEPGQKDKTGGISAVQGQGDYRQPPASDKNNDVDNEPYGDNELGTGGTGGFEDWPTTDDDDDDIATKDEEPQNKDFETGPDTRGGNTNVHQDPITNPRYKEENQEPGTNDKKPLESEVYEYGEEESPSSGHFLGFFLTAVVICISGYVIYHNKQKIMAFCIEGRHGPQGRRRSNGVKYSQLKSNVEEVMPSLEKTTTAKNFVY